MKGMEVGLSQENIDFSLNTPFPSTWLNQKKIYNICQQFCIEMFIMLHIPEVLSHTVMLGL